MLLWIVRVNSQTELPWTFYGHAALDDVESEYEGEEGKEGGKDFVMSEQEYVQLEIQSCECQVAEKWEVNSKDGDLNNPLYTPFTSSHPSTYHIFSAYLTPHRSSKSGDQ